MPTQSLPSKKLTLAGAQAVVHGLGGGVEHPGQPEGLQRFQLQPYQPKVVLLFVWPLNGIVHGLIVHRPCLQRVGPRVTGTYGRMTLSAATEPPRGSGGAQLGTAVLPVAVLKWRPRG